MSRYAKNTSVPVEKSEAEIKATLRRYGADQFVSGWSEAVAYVGFRAGNRHVKFTLPLPARSEFNKTEQGRARRSNDAIEAAWEQACRQRYRALALAIKAKLEAIESGISSFDDEFLAFFVNRDGRTVGEVMRGQLDRALAGNKVDLLPHHATIAGEAP